MSNSFSFNYFSVLCSTLFLGALSFHSSIQAAEQPCGAENAVEAFTTSATEVILLLPALDKEIDLCFNPSRPQYILQTRNILKEISATYTTGLTDLGQAFEELERGQNAEFIKAAPPIIAQISKVTKPLIDNASNLKNHGFTTSDSTTGGRYKYPQCNSKINNQPEKQWSTVYGHVQSLQRSLVALQSVVSCLRTAR